MSLPFYPETEQQPEEQAESGSEKRRGKLVSDPSLLRLNQIGEALQSMDSDRERGTALAYWISRYGFLPAQVANGVA